MALDATRLLRILQALSPIVPREGETPQPPKIKVKRAGQPDRVVTHVIVTDDSVVLCV